MVVNKSNAHYQHEQPPLPVNGNPSHSASISGIEPPMLMSIPHLQHSMKQYMDDPSSQLQPFLPIEQHRQDPGYVIPQSAPAPAGAADPSTTPTVPVPTDVLLITPDDNTLNEGRNKVFCLKMAAQDLHLNGVVKLGYDRSGWARSIAMNVGACIQSGAASVQHQGQAVSLGMKVQHLLAGDCARGCDMVLVESWGVNGTTKNSMGLLGQSVLQNVTPPSQGFDPEDFVRQLRRECLPQNLALGDASLGWALIHSGNPRNLRTWQPNPVARDLTKAVPGAFPWCGCVLAVPLIVVARSSANSVWNPEYGMPAVHCCTVPPKVISTMSASASRAPRSTFQATNQSTAVQAPKGSPDVRAWLPSRKLTNPSSRSSSNGNAFAIALEYAADDDRAPASIASQHVTHQHHHHSLAASNSTQSSAQQHSQSFVSGMHSHFTASSLHNTQLPHAVTGASSELIVGDGTSNFILQEDTVPQAGLSNVPFALVSSAGDSSSEEGRMEIQDSSFTSVLQHQFDSSTSFVTASPKMVDNITSHSHLQELSQSDGTIYSQNGGHNTSTIEVHCGANEAAGVCSLATDSGGRVDLSPVNGTCGTEVAVETKSAGFVVFLPGARVHCSILKVAAM